MAIICQGVDSEPKVAKLDDFLQIHVAVFCQHFAFGIGSVGIEAPWADLARERRELSEDPDFEREELAQIYVGRGVETALARQVAKQLMAKDALGAHARDELGISEITSARPVQAAMTSAATFAAVAAAPLALVLVSPPSLLIPVVSVGSLLS